MDDGRNSLAQHGEMLNNANPYHNSVTALQDHLSGQTGHYMHQQHRQLAAVHGAARSVRANPFTAGIPIQHHNVLVPAPQLNQSYTQQLAEQVAANYQQAMSAYLPATITPNSSCFCQCTYNAGYQQVCAFHNRTLNFGGQQMVVQQQQQPARAFPEIANSSYYDAMAGPSTLGQSASSSLPHNSRRNTGRSQFKRQMTESISVTSSSEDDDSNLNINGAPESSYIPLGRKAVRVRSPLPSQTFGTNQDLTETIDLVASSDDDEPIIEPGNPPNADMSPSVHIAVSHAVPAVVIPPGPSVIPAQTPSSTVQAMQQQECRHAHCNCHSFTCGCVQCPASHWHHCHNQPANIVCQLHSPCDCPTRLLQSSLQSSAFANASADFNRFNSARMPTRPAQYHSTNRLHGYSQHQNVQQQQQQRMRQTIHPEQQQLRENQSSQMERSRHAQSHFFRQRAAAVAAQRNINAYLPSAFPDWPSMTAATPTDSFVAASSSSPFLMLPHTAPSTQNILIPANPIMRMPVELSMGMMFQAPIFLHSADGYVLNGPNATEAQPIGASYDQIERCTIVSCYAKETNVPAGEEERCTVCLADFETGERIRSLQCTHLFHTDCIDRWLVYNKKCPVCRIDMDKTASARFISTSR